MTKFNAAVLFSTLSLASGCASIVSDSQYPVKFTSSPDSIKFTISDEHGRVVHSGVTPQVVTLEASDGYFDGMNYQVTFEPEGGKPFTQPFKSALDEWYIGNILFGGLIGMLIVDPVTGSMYKLPKEVGVSYGSTKAKDSSAENPEESEIETKGVNVISLKSISAEDRKRLVKIG